MRTLTIEAGVTMEKTIKLVATSGEETIESYVVSAESKWIEITRTYMQKWQVWAGERFNEFIKQLYLK
jgi:hypothetical protein